MWIAQLREGTILQSLLLNNFIDYKRGTFPQKDTFLLGKTPDILTKIGLAQLPLTMDRTHISYALDGSYRGSEERVKNHILPDTELGKIPALIADPVAIIQDRQLWEKKARGYSLDVLVDMKINGKKTLVAININSLGYINGERIDSNRVQTVHGNDDTVQRLVNALNEDSEQNISVYYINKKKADDFLRHAGNPISRAAQELDGFIHSVTDVRSPVKMRISSVVESRQFVRWFGDWEKHPGEASKIVNADGTPKVMYHGSPAQFTIFDKKKAKSSGQYGRGFYFTDSETHANTYGQKYSVYLNIRNPLQYGKETVSRAQVKKFLEAVAENEDYSVENYGTYDVDSVLENVMGAESAVDAFQVIQDINATAIGDMVEAAELFNKVNGTKFDGIIAATETVAFYPEQIKSATDNIGTFDGGNPDIRYSARRRQNPQKDQSFLTMGGNIHALIEKASCDAGFTPNVIAKINDIACYRTMMRSGIAIGYRRDSSKDPENGLRYLNVTDLEMIQHMGIHYKKDADGTVKTLWNI